MNLKDLKKPLQLKWRVKALKPDNKNPKEMVLVPYVDARQVQDRLDDVLEARNWQDDYFEVKGKQFCKIGIKIGEEWIWKGDSGIESHLDPTKGETSDAFKRAAVHWGINRDTYELGEITIKCKVVNELPVPVDSKGNQLSGDTLLAECKRISALKDSELKFDRNVLPLKSAIITEVKKTRSNSRKKAEPLP
ncbi:Rad52/Rad22 family DNA repair protein [Chryseobacterium indoltheticum]|uniref:DNA damage response protein A n=1 Tax=Chryseobacterium indoltheticum TaxID=254 RepID=A0A381FA47_9FLAO|nr:Rad52/Rad22 family DNA repair protein [Chryseobacterium indoltheticum]SIR25147.1 Rad52/22 family double-strand break repair protein [Chryseobacterium indoltheticum]SUX43451.1 DNA damage response protein A [Chryseobacterium indoltheticum]